MALVDIDWRIEFADALSAVWDAPNVPAQAFAASCLHKANDAVLLIEKYRKGSAETLWQDGEWHVWLYGSQKAPHHALAPTLPEAICKAWLAEQKGEANG